MNYDAAESSLLAGRIPGLSKIADRLAAVMKHVRAIGPPLLMRSPNDLPQLPPQRKRPAVLILADLGAKAKLATRKIDIAPFERAHLAHAPSGQIEERHRVFQIRRKTLAQREERTVIEKSPPRIVFFEQRNVWRRSEFAGTGCERERALQRGELTVDAAVRRALLLPLAHVPGDSIGCYVNGAVEPEKTPQMTQGEPNRLHRSLPIDLVVGQQHLAQIFES